MENEDVEIRTTKILFAKNGNGYTTTRITLPVPWVKEMGFNNADRTATLKFDGKKIIINKEDFKMEEMIKELKEELLNKKMTLVEMDNTAQGITNCTEGIFDYLEDCLAQNSVAYYITEDKNIIVEFEVVKENDDATKIEVKVTDIWED